MTDNYESHCCENVATTGYTPCGAPVPNEVQATGAMGSMVMCERHFLAYHKVTTVAAVAARQTAIQQQHHRCARCGSPASWVAGAGEALCLRHQDDY
jgi:hypothetical protein